MDHDQNYRDACELVITRARTNRIRIETQKQLTAVIEILDVLHEVPNPADWIAAAKECLTYIMRDLDKLPHN